MKKPSDQDLTSMQIFRSYIKPLENQEVDTTQVFSKDCYNKWISTRRVVPSSPEEAFRRVLTAHVRGSDGRKPFHLTEETSLLKQLREKRIWPCFIDNCTTSRIGINGFRAAGYHEKQGTNGEAKKGKTAVSVSSKRVAKRKRKQKVLAEIPEEKMETGLFDDSPTDLFKDVSDINEMARAPSPTNSHLSTCSGMRSNAGDDKPKFLSSYEVFVRFAVADKCGLSKILTRECFHTWVQTRRHGLKNAEHSFRKALIAHLCGKDGRRPFPIDLECLVVKEIRKKRIWPCFSTSTDQSVVNIGRKGFRHLAYHEGRSANLTKATVFKELKKKAKLVESRKNKSAPKQVSPGTMNQNQDMEDALGVFRPANKGDASQPDVLQQWLSAAESNNMGREIGSPAKKGRLNRCLPSFYMNPLDTSRRLDDVVHYDPYEELISVFDVKEKTTSAPEPETSTSSASSDTSVILEDLELDNWVDDPFDLSDCLQLFSDDALGRTGKSEPVLEHSRQPLKEAAACRNTLQKPEFHLSILETFEDVTPEEVSKVVHLRELAYGLFATYFQRVNQQLGFRLNFPTDICGDVKLLRTLRMCRGDVSAAMYEIQSFLTWREMNNVEVLRREIISENISFADIKAKFDFGEANGCHPFYSQAGNGDITDIWVIQEQSPIPQRVNNYFEDHLRLSEFRSLVLDKLSYAKRRIVGYKIIIDCKSTAKKNEKTQALSTGCDWWTVYRMWSNYVADLSKLVTRWYGGFCMRMHVFGSGRLFNVISTSIAGTCLGTVMDAAGKLDIVESNDETGGDNEGANTPRCKESTEALSRKKLSTFGSSDSSLQCV